MDQLAEIEQIARRIGGSRVSPAARLFHDLGIAGDDAAGLLGEVVDKFGTSFEGLKFDDYFPDEAEAMPAFWLQRLGIGGRRWKPMTVRHLAEVASHGKWFEPAPSVRVWTPLRMQEVFRGFSAQVQVLPCVRPV